MRFSVAAITVILGRPDRFRRGMVGCAFLAVLAISASSSQIATAQQNDAPKSDVPPAVDSDFGAASDAAVMCQLFGEPLLQQNAGEVCLRSRRLPPEQRYDELLRWVLPGDGHAVRLQGAFRRSSSREGQTEAADESNDDLQSYPESEWMLSPARDLIDVAVALHRLDHLRVRLARFQSSDREQLDARSAMQCLIEIAAGNTDAVTQHLADRFAWTRSTKHSGSSSQRWSDLLVLWSAEENAVTSQLVTEELFGVYPELPMFNEDIELDVLNDYLRLIQGRKRYEAIRRSEDPSGRLSTLPNSQFETFSRVDASTHGNARPLPRFHIGPDGAYKVSGHEFDYLAYRGPVAGDFEVSAEVATHEGAFTEMIVHGLAVQPVGDGDRTSIGGFAKGNREIENDPPIEEIESSSHLRVRVRDGMAKHFFNGRAVFETDVHSTSAPWIALRSWRRTTSEIRNLHLVGSPSPVESIDLLADSTLGGWASYYDSDSNSGMGNWTSVVDDRQTVQLVGNAVSGVPGSFDEDLIRYVRPISWDAQIEYKFEYQPGTVHVHPALGRSVLMVTPEGVRLHQITDGQYEQTGLRPDNASNFVSLLGESPVRPPLNPGWNSAELTILGSEVTLKINGHSVAQIEMPNTSQRTFGLFRYRDQTRSVVRHLRLKGDWPRTFPKLDQQPLASKLVLDLNRAREEKQVRFFHDFREGIPPELFDVDGDETSLRELRSGLGMTRTSDAGARDLRFCAMIHGDFDITAGYRDLEMSDGEPTWHCGIGLMINLNNPTRDRCAINRRRDRMQGHHYIGFGQKEINAGGKLTWVGGVNVVDESTSGRLRLVRMGDTIFGLHAIGNSPTFRNVATTKVPPGPIALHGLRLIADAGQGMRTNVTWTDLEVLADGIDFLSVADPPKTLATLNELRQKKHSEIIDLTKQTLGDLGIYWTTSLHGQVTSDAQGATVKVLGDESLERFSLIKSLRSLSDFDIQADFEITRLDPGFQEQASSEVVLQIRLEDSEDFDPERDAMQIYEASIILRHKWNGTLDLRPRVVARGRGGTTLYLPIRSIPVKMPDQYRIVQHDRRLYFLYSEIDSPETKIIGTYPLDRDLKASGIRLWVIASRDQRAAEISWKKIEIHGTPADLPDIFNVLPHQPLQP